MTQTLARPQPPVAHSSPIRPVSAEHRRDPWFDNAKMLLVVLVVVGHSWTLLDSSFGSTWA